MSALPVFYEDATLTTGNLLSLSEETARHIVQVLRMNEGERLRIANGKGRAADAVIRETGKKRCTVAIEKVLDILRPVPVLHLGIAFTKNTSRNEWLLEKATELGVQRIIPLTTARSERERFRFDRWNGILISAMMQSQQYWLPELAVPVTLKELFDVPFQGITLIGHCMDEPQRQPVKAVLEPAQNVLLLIGPEGDFTQEEVTLAVQYGARGISLGTTRLRTETAAMAACAYFHLLNDDTNEGTA